MSHLQIKVVPLGAGQDVGRSCILLSIGGKNIMLDCGMHMGYQDDRRFPDFSYISKTGRFSEILDCVIISHFHLDHCGALPFFTEMCGYDGPIFMTYPTKAVVPIMLEDMRKIAVEKKGETNFFTSNMIKNCMKKVIAVNLHQTFQVDDELEIKAYYAGHVLGAAMFHIKVGSQSVVYTGDYNMTPDRHLGSAWIEKVRPDLLITETTYATTIRDSKRCRERDFLRNCHDTVERGGKVLIPVFALGRAQELCILLDTYWERMGLKAPIYFSAGLTERANFYYKLFIHWTNQKIKTTFVQRNMFDFKHIRPFEKTFGDAPGGMVLFATPGMLHAGTSLEMFKKWAPSELNMCILPGYCVAGTVGNRLQTNKQGPQKIEIDKRTTLDVRCQVKNLSFSAHADSKGIMQLIRQVEPKNVLLVHGEKQKMAFLKQRIIREVGVSCYDPPNGHSVSIATIAPIPVHIASRLLKKRSSVSSTTSTASSNGNDKSSLLADEGDDLLIYDPSAKKLRSTERLAIEGVLLFQPQESVLRLLTAEDAVEELGLQEHQLQFQTTRKIPSFLAKHLEGVRNCELFVLFEAALRRWLPSVPVVFSSSGKEAHIRSLKLRVRDDAQLGLEWSYEDEELASQAIAVLNRVITDAEEKQKGL